MVSSRLGEVNVFGLYSLLDLSMAYPNQDGDIRLQNWNKRGGTCEGLNFHFTPKLNPLNLFKKEIQASKIFQP